MASLPNGVIPLAPAPLQTYPYPGLNLNDSQAPRIIATCVTLIVISTVAVALRFIARHLSRAGLWWDDWTILMALVTSYGAIICGLVAIPIGFGRHMGALGGLLQRISVASQFFKLFYAYEIIYGFSIALTKYSILLFYSRIFKDRLFKIALWTTLGLVTAFTFAIEVAVWAQCQPARAFWDLTIQPRNCIDPRTFFIGSSIPNVLLNTIILVLPLPMVWQLEIERRHKLALSGVFLLGGFIVIVSIIRVVVLSRVEEVDITWVFVDGAIWTAVEPAIAVVSACLPIMRSLWIWSSEKSEARKSAKMNSQANVQQEHSRGSLQLEEKPFHTNPAQRHYPINELSGDVERGFATKTDLNSEYTSSTLRNTDSPAHWKRGLYSKSPDYSNYSNAQQRTVVGSNGHSRNASGSEGDGAESGSSSSSTANLRSGLPIQRNESPMPARTGPQAPVQDLSGAYFPGKVDEIPEADEPAELDASERAP